MLATVLADREMGLALGAVEYLTKPIDAEKLTRTLEAIGTEGREALIVDDDKVSRDLLRRILVKQGWRVHEAHNGRRGLEQIDKHKPQLVLLDLMMPEMDGFELLNEIRRLPDLDDISVVVVTSKDLSGEEVSWLRAHAASVVMKGANSRAKLVQALERQIRGDHDPIAGPKTAARNSTKV